MVRSLPPTREDEMNALMPGPLNRTEAALLARNVDSQTASQLRKDGWTLGGLKQRSPQELRAFGLEDAAIDAILSGGPPADPYGNTGLCSLQEPLSLLCLSGPKEVDCGAPH